MPLRVRHPFSHPFCEIAAVAVDLVKEIFGQVVRRKMREDAEVGVQLVGVARIQDFREFFLDAAQGLMRNVAAVRFQKCAEVFNASVGIGDDCLFVVNC